MKAVLFCLALFLALASVQAVRLPTAYRPSVILTSSCYQSYYVSGTTTFHFRWNTTKDAALRANVAQWQIQVSDLSNFASGSQWWTDNSFPGDTFTWDYVVGNGALRCWGTLYIRVRAISSTGQTGPWSAVGTAKRGGLVPPKTSNLIVNKVGNGRINIAAV